MKYGLLAKAALFAAILSLPAALGTHAQAATAVYVGSEASEEGTAVIAVNEDAENGAEAKLFTVEEGASKSGRYMKDTGAAQDGFSVPLPKTTYKYTCLADPKGAADGSYGTLCTNEYGLAVAGMPGLAVSDEYAALDPCAVTGTGLRGAVLPGLVACQSRSAKEAVTVLAEYLDAYGAEETGTLLFSDPEEAWIFEIYGGSTYAAMVLPADKAAVFGNQAMLGWVDFHDAAAFVFSPALRQTLDRLADPVTDDAGCYHLAMCVTGGTREEGANLRTWRGQALLAPSAARAYSGGMFYDLLFTPDKPVSVTGVMALYRDRYEDTPYSPSVPGNEETEAVGSACVSDVCIAQCFTQLPKDTCQVTWLCMGGAEHGVFVPAFSGIRSTYGKYRVQGSGKINSGYFFTCRKVSALAATDRGALGQGVAEHYAACEAEMLARVKEELPRIGKAYGMGSFVGQAYVTALSKVIAHRQYKDVCGLYDSLCYIGICNADGASGEKAVYTAG